MSADVTRCCWIGFMFFEWRFSFLSKHRWTGKDARALAGEHVTQAENDLMKKSM